MKRHSFIGLACLILLMSMLAGCERQTARELISIGITEGGTPVINWNRCDSQTTITRIRLVSPNGRIVDDENDEILWEVTSSGSSADRFTIGESPPGFTEVVPLTQALAKDRRVTAIVDVDGLVVPIDFSLSELKPGLVFTPYDGLVTEDAWRASSRGSCH